MTRARVQPPGGERSRPGGEIPRDPTTTPASTAARDPTAVPASAAARDSTMTVRQPITSQEASTTQVTRPRPAIAPSGTVPGATPPCQGRPVPHQVEVQTTVAPAATA